nr:beta-N-acetylhexosaminidase [Paramuribaculum sp.]
MKFKFISVVASLTLSLMSAVTMAQETPQVNLTPWPQQLQINEGSFTLAPGTTVGIVSGSDKHDYKAEIHKFINAVNKTTGLGLKESSSNPVIAVTIAPDYEAEGYGLEITPAGINISASTPTGLFYAFQSIKKMLPANVSAGKPVAGTVAYTLPCLTIADNPRFEYRGFMLDVSRHFYDVAELKKMLDIMSVYKLNRFHWHLTDDQGWRLPMPKYPKLTQEGAIHHNTLRTNFSTQEQWREGQDVAYGPYSYTEDEIREIVDYAKDLHIEVIPEIDMPGHMVAAIHAYPEFSCNPDSSWGEEYNHEVWNKGGVSRDVLDISKPEVQQFVKDVVDQLANLFPYEYIHIGGDECPTDAWAKSESVQEFKKQKGFDNDTQLQTWFTKMIADYAHDKYGKKIYAWNEFVTNDGADLEMVKTLDDPVIFCWYPPQAGVDTAEANGWKHVYTPFHLGYYINRAYKGFDKYGAGGDGALSQTYSHNPPSNEHCIGVQGTFWCEQVDRPEDLEYLALPRLIAIAEQGWTPENLKDYDNFSNRMIADKELLEMGGYNFGKHQIVDKSKISKPDPEKWYKMTSLAMGPRYGRAWEVISEDSPLNGDFADNGAEPGKLWSNDSFEGNDYQLFKFIEDPANPGNYAIICKGVGSGSLNPQPVKTGNGDRWQYDPENVVYGFVLDAGNYGENQNGSFHYSIRSASDKAKWLNYALGGQGFSINVYNDPADGRV